MRIVVHFNLITFRLLVIIIFNHRNMFSAKIPVEIDKICQIKVLLEPLLLFFVLLHEMLVLAIHEAGQASRNAGYAEQVHLEQLAVPIALFLTANFCWHDLHFTHAVRLNRVLFRTALSALFVVFRLQEVVKIMINVQHRLLHLDELKELSKQINLQHHDKIED